jgi:cell division protein FtsI (penicillin-binding protein 3)
MKPFLLASALENGVVNDSELFDVRPAARQGKTLHDASELGSATIAEMTAMSSNVGYAQLFDRVGGARLERTLAGFHFVTPLGLASAKAGDWDGALTAIGATMTTTPRQVARAYATLAAGGDGVVSKPTAAHVTRLLEGVVTGGTGKQAHVEGVRVAGKTGTSEWKAADGTTANYASFVGYVPADAPRYIVFVGVEAPKGDEASGGQVAAPVFSRVAARALAR